MNMVMATAMVILYSAYLDENEKNEDENKINKFQKFITFKSK